MTRVLVLGGSGATGRRAAAELTRSEEVSDLIVAGRSYEPVRRLASLFGDRVRPVVVDIEDEAGLAAACSATDVVVNCTGPAHLTELPCVRGAIEAGVRYVSLCDDQAAAGAIVGLDGRARETGALIVSGCGLSPGITTLLVHLAYDELDEVDEVEIGVAPSYADLVSEARAAHLVHLFAQPVSVISDHERALEPHSGGPNLTYLPEPVGWVETFACAHPELHQLASLRPAALTVRVGLTERPVMDAVRALSAGPLAFQSPKLAKSALSIALALPPRGPRWSAARVDVVGRKEGHATTISLGVVDHLINLATAPMVLAALGLGSGAVEGSGVKSLGEAFDARRFLAALANRGARVARLEPEHV